MKGRKYTIVLILALIGILISMLGLLLRATKPTPPATPTKTIMECIKEAGESYPRLLDVNQHPVRNQVGQIVGWIYFQNGQVFKGEGHEMPSAVNELPFEEGIEYTVDLNFRVGNDSIATLELTGFMCGGDFYYTFPLTGPLYVSSQG